MTGRNPIEALAHQRHEFGEHGGVNMSIEASSTFTVLEPGTMPEMFKGLKGHDAGCYLYGRHFNPTVYNLGLQLAALEGTEAAYCAASGMAAISSTLFALCESGDHIVASSAVYGGTYAFLNDFLPVKTNVQTTFVPMGDLGAVERAITPRTKMILLNSPANPTGVTAAAADLKQVAELTAEKNIALVSDEIYSNFHYDDEFVSPAIYNDQTIVIDGFSKSHAMTGWRVGYVHGPTEVMAAMLKLQQYSFVCAPQPAQWGAIRAMEVSLDGYLEDYRRKRDLVVEGLSDCYEMVNPGGAFYVFPKAPVASGAAFVEEAISRGLLIIPGNIFSHRDSHFRISFAAPDETLHRGIELLRELARK